MPLIKLFLLFFRVLAAYFIRKNALFSVFALIWLENQHYKRYFTQHHIQSHFEAHEKQAVHTFFCKTNHAASFFSLIAPKTILSAWKNAIAHYWTQPHRNPRPGRPQVTREVRELIKKMKIENYLWGCRRIRDELAKLSISISHEAIRRIIQNYRNTGEIKPNLSWKRFLSAHWASLFACDFFTVTALGFITFYIFFIIELKSRKIIRTAVTTHPTIPFLRLQLSDFEYNHPGTFLIHDNSGELRYFPYREYKFTSIPITPYSPNMNAYAERFVRSVRTECLDYFIIFNENQLRRILKEYIFYYNNYRPHQGSNHIPNGPPDAITVSGKIMRKPFLFGLHNHYYRKTG
jgi:transposase InsO family protein